MNNAPIRHHYIPQFILRNFCYDSSKKLMFFDKSTKSVSSRYTTEVFMEKDLYRDEANNKEDPTYVESAFAKYESEVSLIFKKCLSGNDIVLSNDEYESLIFFLVIMGLRSKNAKEDFFNDDSSTNNNLNANKNQFINVSDLWKRNLGELAKCRSIKEVENNQNIGLDFKYFVKRDYKGKYINIMERRGKEDFCIGDCYPVVITGDFMNLPMFDYYPISPNRIIVLATKGVIGAPESVRKFNDSNLKLPLLIRDKKHKQIHVTKIYEYIVKCINDDILKNSRNGIAFKDELKVSRLLIERTK